MTISIPVQTEQYASCVSASKRVRWDIDADVLRGRNFDTENKFLPDSITGIQRLEFLDEQSARLLSQIQGTHLRQHVWPGGALHQLQDSGIDRTPLDR